jgi:hypothetical protein
MYVSQRFSPDWEKLLLGILRINTAKKVWERCYGKLSLTLTGLRGSTNAEFSFLLLADGSTVEKNCHVSSSDRHVVIVWDSQQVNIVIHFYVY